MEALAEDSDLSWSQRTAVEGEVDHQDRAKAMRAAGAPRFAAVHALRRKFTNDEIEDETKHRLKAGSDTTAASIASSVSISQQDLFEIGIDLTTSRSRFLCSH